MFEDSDLQFWKKVFSDHMRFLSTLLKPLYRRSLSKIREMEGLWQRAEMEDLPRLLEDALQLKRRLLDLSHTSITPSNLKLDRKDYEDLLNHMIEETVFARDMLDDLPGEEEIMTFWLNHTEEDMRLIINTLTSNEYLKEDLIYFLDVIDISSYRDVGDLIREFKDKSEGLAYLIDKREVTSLMDIDMLMHEITETKYGMRQMSDLGLI
jgi:hypothetical protein